MGHQVYAFGYQFSSKDELWYASSSSAEIQNLTSSVEQRIISAMAVVERLLNRNHYNSIKKKKSSKKKNQLLIPEFV